MIGVSRRVLIGGVVAAVVLVAAWWMLMWAPRAKDYKTAQASTTAAQAQVSQLQAQVARLRSLSSQSGALKTELTSLQSAVPDGADIADFFLAANDAAQKSGVTLNTIAPTEPTAAATQASSASGPISIPVSMTLNGGYYQVLDFINRLDSLPRLVMIDSVNAAANSTGPELGVTLKGRVFEVKAAGTTASSGGQK